MPTIIYQKVLSLITQPPEKRTDAEIDQLLPWFQKKEQIFRSLKKDVVKDIVRNCQFFSCDKDYVIIKQGDRGECFYIILSGQISIYINNKLGEENERTDPEVAANTITADRTKFGMFITTLDEGHSFGEIALISKDCVRNASIIADCKTDLLVVDRDLYNRSLRAAQEQEFNAKTQFVNTCHYFSNWQPKYKRQVAMSLVKETVPFDRLIVKQGDPVAGLYFLMNGQAKVIIDPQAHKCQYSAIQPIWESQFMRYNYYKNIFAKEEGSSYKLGKRHNGRVKHQELCIVAPIETIGDAEVTMELPSYLQSVVAMQSCEVYSLTVKNYERLVIKKYPKTMEMMRLDAEHKLQRRLERLPDHHTRFLRCLEAKLQQQNGTNIIPITDFRKLPRIGKNGKKKYTVVRVAEHGPIGLVDTPRLPAGLSMMCDSMDVDGNMFDESYESGTFSEDDGRIDYIASCNAESMQPGMYRSKTMPVSFADHDNISAARNKTPNPQEVYSSSLPDYQTSDEVLSGLEQRIQTWHLQLGGRTKAPKKILKLRRSSESSVPPMPGKTVVMYQNGRRRDVYQSLFNDDLDAMFSESVSDDMSFRIDSASSTSSESRTNQGGGTRAIPIPGQARSHLNRDREAQHKQVKLQRNYSMQEYNNLREMLRQKQRLMNKLRPMTL